jgi:hypothetical protein
MDFAHPGPIMTHLSQVPDGLDIRGEDGSGGWVKIYTLRYELFNVDLDHINFLAHNYTGALDRVSLVVLLRTRVYLYSFG